MTVVNSKSHAISHRPMAAEANGLKPMVISAIWEVVYGEKGLNN